MSYLTEVQYEECFILVGGSPCFPAGSSEAASASAAQSQYAPNAPNPWYVRPIESTVPTTTLPNEEMECFILVGGNFCYPIGSLKAEQAAKDEAEYLKHLTTLPKLEPENSSNTTSTLPTTTSTTIFEGSDIVVDGDRNISVTAPNLGECYDGITEFGFQKCEVEVASSSASLATQTPVMELPATGIGTEIALVATVMFAAGMSLLSLSKKKA